MEFVFYPPAPFEFGRAGMAPRWMGLTGCLRPYRPGTRLMARIGPGSPRPLWLGPDGARLAEPGDFNLELCPAELLPGDNEITFEALAPDGDRAVATTTIHWHPGTALIPPRQLDIDLRRADGPPPGLHVGDGRWQKTDGGWRTAFPAYDRFLNLGDRRWENYEVYAEMILHRWRTPDPRSDAGANVIHIGIALRWPGHAEDGHQPRTQWYPLGIAFEWRVDPAARTLRLRGLDPASIEPADGNGSLPLLQDGHYAFRARATHAAEGGARYAAKGWLMNQSEPTEWSLVHHKRYEPIRCGSALLVAHYTDATIVRATVRPV